MALSPVRPRASRSAGSADTIAFTRSYSPAFIASMNAASVSVSIDGLYLLRGCEDPRKDPHLRPNSPLRDVPRSKIVFAFVSVVSFVSFAIPAASQTPSGPIERPPLGSTLTVDALGDLPSGGNLFTLLDTVVPEVITDRVDTGGLTTGSAARIGAHGSSWTQAVFRLDGVDITSADGTGAPLLLPGIVAWDHVDVATGLMPIDINAPGLAISLAPRRPTAEWTREIEAVATGPALLAHTALTNPPPTARLNAAAYGSALISGPITGTRAGIVLAGSWNGSSRYERADPTLVDATVASLFTHIVYAPTARDEARFIGWVQRATSPLENRSVFGQPTASEEDRALHGQAVWERHDPATIGWSVFGAYSVRQQSPDAITQTSIAIDRIID